MEWISKLLDINKIPTRIIILICIISLFLLYLPEEIIKNLSLTEFKTDYGKYFGICFIASTGLLLLMIITWLINRINSQHLKSKYKKVIKESINNLDSHEKAVLREFYIQGKHTLKIPMDNPTVSGLIDKRMLYSVGQYGKMSLVGMLFNYSITDFARENLTCEILELPVGEPSENEIERIRESRPKWMIKLESNQRFFVNH